MSENSRVRSRRPRNPALGYQSLLEAKTIDCDTQSILEQNSETFPYLLDVYVPFTWKLCLTWLPLEVQSITLLDLQGGASFGEVSTTQ